MQQQALSALVAWVRLERALEAFSAELRLRHGITALQHAVLCTQFALEAAGAQHDLVFHTPAGQRRLRLSGTGLHRWLLALHMVLRGTDWADWPAAPDWLTRSYLPPALQSLLTLPPGGPGLDDEADEGDAPRPGD